MKQKPVITDYRWRKLRILYLILLIIFILLIPSIILSVYIFRRVDYLGAFTEAYPLQDIYRAKDYDLNEIVHMLNTADGESLWYSEIRAGRPSGVIIYLAAQKEPSVTYFYGHAKEMLKEGYSSFLLELRAHGKSTGSKLGLGYTEVEDVRAMVARIKEDPLYANVPIIVQGVSLGGTVAINSTGLIPEVDACIAMSPFASPDTQIDLIMKKYFIPGFLRAVERPIIHQTLRLLYSKEQADTYTPEVQIQQAGNKKMLIIAAAQDPVLSVENTYRLQKISSNAEFWIRETADHYVIRNNDFKNVSADKDYWIYLKGFLDGVKASYKKK